MPLDATNYATPARELTEDEARDLAILKGAKRRISSRWRWVQNSTGWTVFGFSRYCAQSAITEEALSLGVDSLSAIRRVLAHTPYGGSLPGYNDDDWTTHTDVVALFDRTIAELEP